MANDSFGDRLRTEREDRGLTIAAVAEALRVDRSVLEALERDDFAALPGEAAMTECLNGYAECLEVDADLMIEDYNLEREQRRPVSDPVPPAELSSQENTGAGSVAEEIETPVTEPAAVFRSQSAGKPLSSLLPIGLGLVAIVALAGWGLLGRGDLDPASSDAPIEPRVLSSQASSTPKAAIGARPPESRDSVTKVSDERQETVVEPPAEDAQAPEEPPAARPTPRSRPLAPTAPEPTTTSSLRISEYGVGTGVENRVLVGRSDRFSEGTRVAFWTRVLSAQGLSIHHVWLREGVEENRLLLKIGGSNWRTHSTKRLPAGSAGSWAVEARDEAGNVLVRAEFESVR